jgi:glycine/D-amino acid oxidase-like deaminating enzyme
MRRAELHVVVGAGIAGCLAAIMRSRAGYRVVVLEREQARAPGTYAVCTQTSNIVSENHSGAEYPFDPQSARDCLDGRIANERFFPSSVYGGKTYSRIIASQSMMDDGYDIVGQCRANMEVIRSHYARRCAEDRTNAVFGPPSAVCRELSTPPEVNDIAAVFLTPQRGVNPVLVSSFLEDELKAGGVDFREGSSVTRVSRTRDGRYQVEYVTMDGGAADVLIADQVSVCSATAAFGTALQLNPSLRFPRIFLALRQILYVDLPDGTDKDFTCLKLEDDYGGMFSPLNERCGMIYHPPSAHITNEVMDPASGAAPPEFSRYLTDGHPESEERAERALERLRVFYPELRRSRILGSYLKVAINTVSDSRMRRNIGVFGVHPGCTVTVLPKWTMGVVNARQDLAVALEHSIAIGNAEVSEARTLLRRAAAPQSHWARTPEASRDQAVKHAVNMNVPLVLADGFADRPEPAAAHDFRPEPAWLA